MTAEKLLRLGRAAGRWLLLPAMAVVAWGELTPSGTIELNVWDKLLHFIAYFGLSTLAWAALHRRGRALLGLAGVILLGGILEIGQGMVGRDMSGWDMVANLLGAFAGAILAEIVRRRLEPDAGGAIKSLGNTK